MRTFTDGGILVRGMTPAEKNAGFARAKQLGLRSLSEWSCWLMRQDLAAAHKQKGNGGKQMPRPPESGAPRVTRKLAQWRIPGQGREAEKKNSPVKRPAQHSPVAVRLSTDSEA